MLGMVPVVQSGAYGAKFTYPFVPVQVKNVIFTLRCLHQHHLAKHMLLVAFHFKMGDMKEVPYGHVSSDDMNHAWFYLLDLAFLFSHSITWW